MNTDLLVALLLNPCGMLAAGAVMYVAGSWATTGNDELRRLGAGLAGLALIAVMVFGMIRRMELLGLAVAAAGLGLFLLGACWIVLSLLSFIFDLLASAMTAPHYEPQKEVFAVPEADPEPAPELPPPEPLPTREELASAARERYEAALRMLETAGLDEVELHSARDRAKQKYLREIDAIVK